MKLKGQFSEGLFDFFVRGLFVNAKDFVIVFTGQDLTQTDGQDQDEQDGSFEVHPESLFFVCYWVIGCLPGNKCDVKFILLEKKISNFNFFIQFDFDVWKRTEWQSQCQRSPKCFSSDEIPELSWLVTAHMMTTNLLPIVFAQL